MGSAEQSLRDWVNQRRGLTLDGADRAEMRALLFESLKEKEGPTVARATTLEHLFNIVMPIGVVRGKIPDGVTGSPSEIEMVWGGIRNVAEKGLEKVAILTSMSFYGNYSRQIQRNQLILELLLQEAKSRIESAKSADPIAEAHVHDSAPRHTPLEFKPPPGTTSQRERLLNRKDDMLRLHREIVEAIPSGRLREAYSEWLEDMESAYSEL